MMMTPWLLVAVVVLWVVTIAFARRIPSRGPTRYVPWKVLRGRHDSGEDSYGNGYENAAEVSESPESSTNGYDNTAVVPRETMDILHEYIEKWKKDMDLLVRHNVKYGINLSGAKLSNDTEAPVTGVDQYMVKETTPRVQDEVQDSTLGKARG